MKKNKLFSVTLCLLLVILLFAGCGKENKYVNVGVEESTAGLSLYLTNVAKSLGGVSTYAFFPEDVDEVFEKINLNKQGIDIAYIPVKEIARIKTDTAITVVFVDTFEENGDIKGVWIARDGWLKDAPTYSKKYIAGMVKCVDYRASNMKMTYEGALKSIEGMRDFKFDVQSDVMQFVAIFDQSNKDDVIENLKFTVKSPVETEALFEGFASGSGDGYKLCKAAYDKYCTAADSKSFEDMFNLEMMIEAVEAFNHPEK